MRVSVFGLGYVGTVTAACLANRGHRVIGVDVKPEKVDAINGGYSPILEPGLERLIQAGVGAGSLAATYDSAEAIGRSDIAMICVGTPSDGNGSVNTVYVERVCAEIGRALRGITDYRLISLRSTLPPGIFRERLLPLIERTSEKQAGADFGMAVTPEFLREGSAISDFENPPFTLIGQLDERSGSLLEQLFADVQAPIFHTDPDTASLVKYASNAFHALKVVFANEIGQLCKSAGVDGSEVMRIFCQDTLLNISSRYLKPGFAFGGSCLPKDLRALLYLARHHDVQVPVLEAILPSNRLQIERTVARILQDQRKRVGIIGLTFKPGTDDLRESPMVELVEVLSGKGLQVRIYDDNLSLSRLVGDNKAYIERTIPHLSRMLCGSIEEVVGDSDIVVVAHDCRDGKERLLDALTSDHLLIDFVKIIPNGDHALSTYEGICW